RGCPRAGARAARPRPSRAGWPGSRSPGSRAEARAGSCRARRRPLPQRGEELADAREALAKLVVRAREGEPDVAGSGEPLAGHHRDPLLVEEPEGEGERRGHGARQVALEVREGVEAALGLDRGPVREGAKGRLHEVASLPVLLAEVAHEVLRAGERLHGPELGEGGGALRAVRAECGARAGGRGGPGTPR